MSDSTQNPSIRIASRRTLVRLLFAAACLITLTAIYYAEENWRGKRAWDECRKQLEAKGVDFNWKARIPPPVPDDENIFKAPNMAAWFVKRREGANTNALLQKCSAVGDCIGYQNSNVIAEVTVVGLRSDLASGNADIVLQYTNSVSPSVDRVQSQKLHQVVHAVLWPSATVSNGPSLKGAQGYYTFVAKSQPPSPPVRITVCTDKILGPKEVAALFPPRGDLRVEPAANNVFAVFLRPPNLCPAGDYLACTDPLESDFDQIRAALKRPYARREGDYEHTWEVPIPNFVAVRNVAQILAQRAQCELLLGNPEAALRELTLIHDFSRLIGGKPTTLVAAMINVAVGGLYTSIIAEGLQLHAWREPQLLALQQQLQTLQFLEPLTEAMDTERVSACHMFETTKLSDLEEIFFGFNGPNYSLWDKIKDPSFWALHCMPRGWFYQNMAGLAEREQAFIEVIDPSRGLIDTRKADVIGNAAIAWVTRSSPYTILARVAMPNYLKACQTVAHNQTMANEALVACGLERYRLAHGEYPESLAKLSPEFLSRLPHEVVNDEALKYRRLASNKFLLYSVGWNGVDDGGMPGKAVPEGDWVWEGA